MNQIVCGRAHRLWEPMAEEIARLYFSGARVSLLVPEQYTLQAERDLLRDLKVKGFFRLDVLSPSRLQYRVFDALGADSRVRIDEQGRAVTIARALRKREKELQFYAGAQERPGLIRKMAALVRSFKAVNLTEEALSQSLEQLPDSALKYKLRDSAGVLKAYEELLAGRFADPDDIYRDMLARLERGGMMAGRHVFVYGFDLLTEAMQQLLLLLARQCAGLHLYVVSQPAQQGDGEHFDAVRRSVQRLMDNLYEERLPCRFRWLPREGFAAPLAVAHLEQWLLAIEQPAFEGGSEAVRLHTAPTPYHEAQSLAAFVREQLKSGCPADQIYVLSGNLAANRGLLSDAFESYGVPYHISQKLPLTSHRLVRHLLAALGCATRGYRDEDVEELLRQGYTGLKQEDCWTLDNYARAYGIRTFRWQRPFARGGEAQRQAAEELRLKLTQPLERLREALAGALSASESLGALRAYITEAGLYEQAEEEREELLVQGLPTQAAQLEQVPAKLEEMFTQLANLMQEERVPLRYFALWLQSGLQEVEIGSLPPVSGQVQVGELGNLLLPRPRVVCLTGLQEGILDASDEELLSPDEKMRAEKHLNKSLGLHPDGKQELKLLDFWKAVAAPRESLYLSCALANEEGGALQPLQQLDAIRALLPHLHETGGAAAGASVPLTAPGPALEALALSLAQGPLDREMQDIWAYAIRDEKMQDEAGLLLRALHDEPPVGQLSRALSAALFPPDTVSVSRLETLAACPFEHFVAHGLRLEEKQEWLVKPQDLGSFYHAALEALMSAASRHPDWPDVDEAQLRDLLAQATAPLIAAWEEGPYLDSARQREQSRGYLRLLEAMAGQLTLAAKNSLFRPQGTEIRFGFEGGLPPLMLALEDGEPLRLRGTIDRVDRYTGEEGDFLRVVDYKSSAQGLHWDKVYAGMQLQLLLYLKKALDIYPGSRPAGAFFQRLHEPVISTEDEEKAAAGAQKELRLKGLALEDAAVVRLMDLQEPISLGKVLNKDGSATKGGPLMPEEDIEHLLAHARQKAAELGYSAQEGRISRSPARDHRGAMPCDYCKYGGICRIDPLRDTGARMLPKLSREELLQILRAKSGLE